MDQYPTLVYTPSENALKVIKEKYLRKNPLTGEIIESIPEMFQRIADSVAQGRFDNIDEKNMAKIDKRRYGQEYYDILFQNFFVPNSPTFTGAGTPLGQLAACFVLPIADDLGRRDDSIFSTLRNGALIQQTGGGNGFSFSDLREKDSKIMTSGGKSSGPITFLKIYNESYGGVAQGGTRRGANMAVLRVDHPDIYEFVQCKQVEGDIANFNISINLSDKFMHAVKTDANFDLISRFDGSVKKTVRARHLFDHIIEYAHRNGEPGVLFGDTANKTNPMAHMYTLEATNPCGEQWLGPYENCCLGSINLARMYDPKTKNVDWGRLAQVTKLSTRFLDDVVDANRYVPEIPMLKRAALDSRRIGLGIMGLADLLYQLGIRYGSDEGIAFGAYIMEFIQYISMLESVFIAIDHGWFKEFEGSSFDLENRHVKNPWQIPVPMEEYPTSFAERFKRPHLNWSDLKKSIRDNGIRNSTNTTIAPTGTIATISDVEGYGCEPNFSLAYIRNYINNNGVTEQLTYVSPLFNKALVECGLFSNEQIQDIVNHTIEQGTCQNIDIIPQSIKNVFVVSGDITPEQHVRTQAALQRFVSNSISKTCNLPETATRDDVGKIYMMAWELGCKGLTVYIKNSREKVVLEQKKKTVKPSKSIRKQRPNILPGTTMNLATPMGTLNTTIGFHDDVPFELFAILGKNTSDIQGYLEGFGRLISMILQLEDNTSVHDRIKEIIRQLEGIGGKRTRGLGPNQVSSGPDAIARSMIEILMDRYPDDYQLFTGDSSSSVMKINQLRKSLSESNEDIPPPLVEKTKIVSDIFCPECHNHSIIMKGGCSKCTECTFFECG